jgi:hypothetical protein
MNELSISREMVADLRYLTPFDPEHLPEEILSEEWRIEP